MNIKTGRKAKVIELGLEKKVQELRGAGYTYTEIERLLKQDNPDLDISWASIRRYCIGIGKEYKEATPDDMISELNKMISDILFRISILSSISKSDKQAIKEYVKRRKRVLEKKLHVNYGSDNTLDEIRLREILLEFSRQLCWDCMMKVSRIASQSMLKKE